MRTNANAAIMSDLGSISIPAIFMSEENPIMPAEAIGMDTLSCLNDMDRELAE